MGILENRWQMDFECNGQSWLNGISHCKIRVLNLEWLFHFKMGFPALSWLAIPFIILVFPFCWCLHFLVQRGPWTFQNMISCYDMSLTLLHFMACHWNIVVVWSIVIWPFSSFSPGVEMYAIHSPVGSGPLSKKWLADFAEHADFVPIVIVVVVTYTNVQTST